MFKPSITLYNNTIFYYTLRRRYKAFTRRLSNISNFHPRAKIQARSQIVHNLMTTERNLLTNQEVEEIASLTDGYSGADMKTLCQEACLGPIRAISFTEIEHISPDQVRPVTVEDFKTAVSRVRPSVSDKDIDHYIQWDQTYGSGGAPK